VTASEISRRLRRLGNPRDAHFQQRYFKTAAGEYGHGDRFLGVRVPAVRQLLREARDAGVTEATQLLRSKWHEERLFALLLLVREFTRGDIAQRRAIFDLYLANMGYINNWDLVDTSAPQIVGGYLHDRSHAPLDRLARSAVLWERRIAILATLHFIRHGESACTLRIARRLLDDDEDLIHKATGWMLRETGKHCGRAPLSGFLDDHAAHMPRTMLRYALEHFPAAARKRYMSR
jgi:3-methyladenine DNA glycosylase AlkD